MILPLKSAEVSDPMLDKILQQIHEHSRKFNYKLSDYDKEELIALYEMNHDSYDATTLSLHIENYVRRKSSPTDLEWMDKRRQSVSARRVSPKDFTISTFEKNEETTRFLLAAFGSEIPFCLLTPEQKARLVASMYPIIVEEGTVLIQQGDVGAEMYVIQDGEFDVLVDGKLTNKLLKGSKFGELALLHEIPRTATVRAVRKSYIWAAEQTSFSSIRIHDQLYRREMVRAALTNCTEGLPFPKGKLEIERIVNSATFKIFFAKAHVNIPQNNYLVILKDANVIFTGRSSHTPVLKGSILSDSFTVFSDLECALISLKKPDLSKIHDSC